MKLSIERNILITPLLLLSSVVDKKQTLPILSNILLKVSHHRLTMTTTDLEIELRISIPVVCDEDFEITLPARKFTDICKALPEDSIILIDIKGERASIKSDRSRFSLGALDAKKYPSIDPSPSSHRFKMTNTQLKKLITHTQFAMAHQDVRFYLNGMLLELDKDRVRTVTTDGHRMALSELTLDVSTDETIQLIIPRKAVLELNRLLDGEEKNIELEISSNHLRVYQEDITFISKLIDGNYPDYNRVIPINCDKTVISNKQILKKTLQRTAILSNEKFKGISFTFTHNKLQLLAHNPEQEEARDEVPIEYDGEEFTISFNVGYVIDALNVIASEEVVFHLGQQNNSCLIESSDEDESRYVVMPMKI